MSSARFSQRHARRAALLTVACAALLTTAACAAGTGDGAPARTDALPAAPSARALTSATTAAAPHSSAAAAGGTHASQQSQAHAAQAASAKPAAPACGNADLAMDLGYGTQSYPVQDGSVVITNVGKHTCTLRGYTGAAIVVDGRTINAARTLNLDRGLLPELTSPPLVTLAPGASSYSVLQWVAGKGPGCYPTGTGVLEVTAPNTTRTVVVSRAMIMAGGGGICSGFQVDPVTPGYFGIPTGVPARN